MKSLMLLTGILLLGFAPGTQAGDTGPETAVRQFSAALHSGDAKAAKTFLAKRVVILDEVPPYYWGGTSAFDNWLADLAKAGAGNSDDDAELGQATRVEVSAGHAYVVLPATHSFKQKGVALREKAQLTFILDKDADAWKIASWTWTGPVPKPVR